MKLQLIKAESLKQQKLVCLTQQAELEAHKFLAAELALAQDEKTSLVSAKSTAKLAGFSCRHQLLQSQRCRIRGSSTSSSIFRLAAFVAQSGAAAASRSCSSTLKLLFQKQRQPLRVAQEPVSSETSELLKS